MDNIPDYFNNINQIVPLEDDKWIVFLSYDTYGTYCIIENVSMSNVRSCLFLKAFD